VRRGEDLLVQRLLAPREAALRARAARRRACPVAVARARVVVRAARAAPGGQQQRAERRGGRATAEGVTRGSAAGTLG